MSSVLLLFFDFFVNRLVSCFPLYVPACGCSNVLMHWLGEKCDGVWYYLTFFFFFFHLSMCSWYLLLRFSVLPSVSFVSLLSLIFLLTLSLGCPSYVFSCECLSNVFSNVFLHVSLVHLKNASLILSFHSLLSMHLDFVLFFLFLLLFFPFVSHLQLLSSFLFLFFFMSKLLSARALWFVSSHIVASWLIVFGVFVVGSIGQ